jgi:uncharacterized protein
MISMMQGVLGLASGALVGFSPGLVCGGGSILAVPLMIYVVGVPDPHVAIGTSVIAVAAGLISWGLAGLFIAGGIGGGLIGTRLARLASARRGALNTVFAAVIIAVALYMLVRNVSSF